jgi:hypothetical protein
MVYSNALIMQVQVTSPEECWVSIGYGAVDNNDDKAPINVNDIILQATVGLNYKTTLEDIKSKPAEVAKNAIATWGDIKRYLDMNFYINNRKGIYKIGNDLNKPLEELLAFVVKNEK